MKLQPFGFYVCLYLACFCAGYFTLQLYLAHYGYALLGAVGAALWTHNLINAYNSKENQ